MAKSSPDLKPVVMHPFHFSRGKDHLLAIDLVWSDTWPMVAIHDAI